MARLVVVTPNPAIDVTYVVARQQIGRTVRVDQVHRRAGGKGVNVARVLAALGRPALAVVPVGGDAGRWLVDDLGQLPVHPVQVTAPTRSTVTVVDGIDHPTVLAEPGLPLADQEWSDLVTAVGTVCERGGTVVVSGSLPAGTDPGRIAALVEAAHARGARAVVDTGGAGLLAAAEARADLVKPNLAEALAATGATDLEAAIAELHRRGAGTVVVALGADGLAAATETGRWTQPAVPGVSGNPTGAGDAATAGLVAALDAGAPLAEALRQAAVVGAAAVRRATAGEIDPADLPGLAALLPAGAGTTPTTERRES